MLGVSPEVATHSLNVDSTKKPMVQKPLRVLVMHAEAVNEEVEKLIDAGAIKEVQYPT